MLPLDLEFFYQPIYFGEHDLGSIGAMRKAGQADVGMQPGGTHDLSMSAAVPECTQTEGSPISVTIPPIATFEIRVALRFQEAASVSSFAGATFRGGFGRAFRRVGCALQRAECLNCILRHDCVYAYVFETLRPPKSEFMKGVDTVPHPFVLRPPSGKDFEAGQTVFLGAILIGRAVRHLPYFLLAFEQLGRLGLGPRHSHFEVLFADAHDSRGNWKTFWTGSSGRIEHDPAANNLLLAADPNEQAAGHLTLEFLTPVRLKSDGAISATLPFAVLVTNLMRRMRALAYFHGPGSRIDYPAGQLIKLASAVTTESRVRRVPLERYSTRQKRHMNMDGLRGTVEYRGNLGPFLNLLRAGELLHVGKGTSFGLGQYRIVELTIDE